MDALQLLKTDHDVARHLFEQFSQAKDGEDTARIAELQRKIFAELEIHTTIEEEVFYPEAKEAGGEAEELIAEGFQEHHVVDVLMGEIRELTPDHDTWVAKMTVLIENVEHHAQEEEEELFPKLRAAFGDERLQQMGDKLAEAKRRYAAGAHPSAEHIAELTREELYERARALDIEGRSSMTKEELAQAIAHRAA